MTNTILSTMVWAVVVLVGSSPASAAADKLFAAGSATFARGGRLGIPFLEKREPTPVLIGNVASIVGNGAYYLAVRTDGTVWGWGYNSTGQLGDGTKVDRWVPVRVGNLAGIVAVAPGSDHSLALQNDGTVWAWGSNGSGQLGYGPSIAQLVPVRVASLTKVVAIAAGEYYSLAVKSDGSVWAWGDNQYGKLGDGTEIDRVAPVRVGGLPAAVAVAAGYGHSLAVTPDGSVWGWGRNGSGQLGDDTTTAKLTPVKLQGLTGVVAVAVSCASYGGHSMALRSDGTIWTWGDNTAGQLGDGTHTARLVPVLVSGLTDVRAIEAGDSNSLAVKSDGTVWTWGSNSAGQLGDATLARATPGQVPGVTGATGAASAYPSGAALLADGSVVTWCSYAYPQLGYGMTGDRLTPIPVTGQTQVAAIAASFGHSLMVKTDGTVWAWGQGGSGELGNGAKDSHWTPVQVSGLTDAVAVSAGDSYSLAIRSDGTAWAWGIDDYSQLGISSVEYGTDVPMQVSNLTQVTGIGAGLYNSVAVRADGIPLLWGGHLIWSVGYTGFIGGMGSPWPVAGLTDVVAVAAGEGHSLALKSDGTVYGWGDNSHHQVSGAWPYSTGESPSRVSNLTDVVGIAAGQTHSVALKSDGTVWAWGSNLYGQLGDGRVQGWTVYGTDPVQVLGLTGVTRIAAGDYQSFAIKSDGTAWGWGFNPYGQLGDGTNINRYAPVQISGLTGVTAIAAGDSHTLFLTESGPKPTSSLIGTWPGDGSTGQDVQFIVLVFDWPVVNVSADDLALSSGSVLSVEGTGRGSYKFAVTGLASGPITATLGGDIACLDGDVLPIHQWTFTNQYAGDIDGNGSVNMDDVVILAAAWGARLGDTNYDPAADVNHDGSVDVADLLVLVYQWDALAS